MIRVSKPHFFVSGDYSLYIVLFRLKSDFSGLRVVRHSQQQEEWRILFLKLENRYDFLRGISFSFVWRQKYLIHLWSHVFKAIIVVMRKTLLVGKIMRFWLINLGLLGNVHLEMWSFVTVIEEGYVPHPCWGETKLEQNHSFKVSATQKGLNQQRISFCYVDSTLNSL